jgi:hypothetical protein
LFNYQIKPYDHFGENLSDILTNWVAWTWRVSILPPNFVPDLTGQTRTGLDETDKVTVAGIAQSSGGVDRYFLQNTTVNSLVTTNNNDLGVKYAAISRFIATSGSEASEHLTFLIRFDNVVTIPMQHLMTVFWPPKGIVNFNGYKYEVNSQGFAAVTPSVWRGLSLDQT